MLGCNFHLVTNSGWLCSVEAFSPETQEAVINHESYSLRVSTKLLVSVPVVSGLYSFIGELEQDDSGIILVARVLTSMHGLDMGLFKKALYIHRKCM